MKLRKDNVTKVAKTEREIRRLKKEGFVEVPVQNVVNQTEVPEKREQATNEGADSSAPLAACPDESVADWSKLSKSDIKAKLDELGLAYDPAAKKENLLKILTDALVGDAE